MTSSSKHQLDWTVSFSLSGFTDHRVYPSPNVRGGGGEKKSAVFCFVLEVSAKVGGNSSEEFLEGGGGCPAVAEAFLGSHEIRVL